MYEVWAPHQKSIIIQRQAQPTNDWSRLYNTSLLTTHVRNGIYVHI